MRGKIPAQLLTLTFVLIACPLAGIALAGLSLEPYLHFPPLTTYVRHAPFSWTAFVLIAVLGVTALYGILRLARVCGLKLSGRHSGKGFPVWGWVALACLAATWVLAWTRVEWFRPLQPYTFTPLWVSFIVLCNAFSVRRTGRSLLTHRRRLFLALFPISALFWWYFEYLNRFVQNWHYQGVDTFGPGLYVIHGTLAFSTVLPAFASTFELLCGYVGHSDASGRNRLRSPPRGVVVVLMLLAGGALPAVGLLPDYLFPLLWISPLVLVAGLQVLSAEPTVFEGDPTGVGRRVVVAMSAALLCGLLWEMWNFRSYAKWVYSVPFVDDFRVFEMPVLGYLGYLPFGLECLVFTDMARRLVSGR